MSKKICTDVAGNSLIELLPIEAHFADTLFLLAKYCQAEAKKQDALSALLEKQAVGVQQQLERIAHTSLTECVLVGEDLDGGYKFKAHAGIEMRGATLLSRKKFEKMQKELEELRKKVGVDKSGKKEKK